jgi:hypothetical protein
MSETATLLKLCEELNRSVRELLDKNNVERDPNLMAVDLAVCKAVQVVQKAIQAVVREGL